jgi:hypothetical protein
VHAALAPLLGKQRETAFDLVLLHRDFDGLIGAGAQRRQRFGIDPLMLRAMPGRLSDQPAALEREHHLVDRRRRHPEESLQIGFGCVPRSGVGAVGNWPDAAIFRNLAAAGQLSTAVVIVDLR